MLDNVPVPMKKRMAFLEELDRRHRSGDVPPDVRLRQVPPDTGKFLACMAMMAPAGTYLEIGTSGGYSALWISVACRELGRKLITFEVLPKKIELARETFRVAGVDDVVDLVPGDALLHLQAYKDVSFCFLDAEKECYAECYDKIVPNMVQRGILVADNVLSHKEILKEMVDDALSDQRVYAMVLPIGSGLLLCVRR
ncbi:MAG: class I SAM-dependent methyltransferase [candidate division WOR-3 bacterium]|nr:MAG: class I SAM-dependent methyltransferase [candidate division WOR-3 bacterium]